jgi:4-hydroxybenzoate polyprenyltransferase
MRELTKDLENIKGDLAQGYKTIPIVYGEKVSKVVLTILTALTLVPIYLLINTYQVGKMSYFFYLSIVLLLVFQFMLWKSNSKEQYLILHNILKLIIVLGVVSIPLIDINLVLNKLTIIR